VERRTNRRRYNHWGCRGLRIEGGEAEAMEIMCRDEGRGYWEQGC
jgi:hypothetical protein